MNANDVLIDMLEDNRRRLRRCLDDMDTACMTYRPDPEANNIAITIWHMARTFDVFLTLLVKGLAPEQELWVSANWAAQTDYDPSGIGSRGWGALMGYSQEEVAAVPLLDKEQSLSYLDVVYDAVKDALANTPFENLEQPTTSLEGKYTKYQCIQMALLDNIRHLGEIFAIESSWKRKQVQK